MPKIKVALLLSPWESRSPILSFRKDLAKNDLISLTSLTYVQSKFDKIRRSQGGSEKTNNFDIVFDFRQNVLPSKIPTYFGKKIVQINEKSLFNFPTIRTLIAVTLQHPASFFKITVIERSENGDKVSFREGTVQTHCGIRKTDENKLKIILSICSSIIFGNLAMKENIEDLHTNRLNKMFQVFSFITLFARVPILLIKRILVVSLEPFKNLKIKMDKKIRISHVNIKKEYNWNIAFSYEPFSVTSQIRFSQIESPKDGFLADPFVYQRDEKTFIFAEHYSTERQKGHISCVEISENITPSIKPVVVEKFHMSFPFIFDYEGNTYMCPETSESKDIRLYRCTNFPLQWKFEGTLMSNVSAADSMIFYHKNKWWLFTNIDSAGVGGHDTELFIFYADSPLTNKWNSHPLNPIYTDSRFARNGGFFRDNGSIFRVSQIKGFDKYANGIRINKVVELSEQLFQEVYVREIRNSPGPVNSDIHHLHSNGSNTVVDYFQE